MVTRQRNSNVHVPNLPVEKRSTLSHRFVRGDVCLVDYCVAQLFTLSSFGHCSHVFRRRRHVEEKIRLGLCSWVVGCGKRLLVAEGGTAYGKISRGVVTQTLGVPSLCVPPPREQVQLP